MSGFDFSQNWTILRRDPFNTDLVCSYQKPVHKAGRKFCIRDVKSGLQEQGRAWKVSEPVFFLRSCAWPKRSGRRSFSLKTCPCSEHGDWSELNFPGEGMTVDGVCYPLSRSARRIVGNGDSILLPTPSAAIYGTSNNSCPGDGRLTYRTKGKRSLETMARRGIRPTPPACDWEVEGGRQNSVPLPRRLPAGRLNPEFVE